MAYTDEEKQFENDSTLTLSLLREAYRAFVPAEVKILCTVSGGILFVSACAGLYAMLRDGTFNPAIFGFFCAVLPVLLLPDVLIPEWKGRRSMRTLRSLVHSPTPHLTYSFYREGMERRLPDGTSNWIPYRKLERIRRTPRLFLLRSRDGDIHFIRLDSFHGCTAGDVSPFLEARCGTAYNRNVKCEK